ncbi:MAG: type I-E CRISPR-associated protein Cse2/CasB [Deltaproteobacteria bacterium]|nr:type I-E CRISPR-associated protein Cse2/CasB [Deltaproteobacteria bacterium]
MGDPLLTAEQARDIRRAYESLTDAERDSLKRCPNAHSIMMDRTFWRLAGDASDDVRLRMAHLVACYPAAPQLADPQGFKPGLFLREVLYPGQSPKSPDEALKYKHLLQARDVDELVPRMRKLLAEAGRPVDWGVLGRDLFNWSDKVRKAWDKDFYAPGATS